jgi:hypothetical protein
MFVFKPVWRLMIKGFCKNFQIYSTMFKKNIKNQMNDRCSGPPRRHETKNKCMESEKLKNSLKSKESKVSLESEEKK